MAIIGSQDVQIGNSNFVSTPAPATYDLGTRGYTKDGRAFRYVQAGAVALVAGEVIQSPAVVAGSLARAVNTTSGVAQAATVISVTCGSSVAAGFYNDGFLMIASGAGQGLQYQIRNHPAVSTGATGAFTLYDEDALTVAITTTSTVSLFQNKYSNVIQMPVTTATGVAVGVATYPIAVTQFGWIQTWGPCPVKGDDTTAIGAPLNAVAATAGRASGFTAAGLLTGQILGYLMQAAVQAQWVEVDLRIAP